MRTIDETMAYITIVEEDHLIAVPQNIPTGSTVAVVMLPPSDATLARGERVFNAEQVRQDHFAAVMEALAAVADKPAPADQYTNEELDALIEKARKASRPL
jgi:hypothetical protein